ncbi:EF-hand domain-containing protein [Sphingomonas sp. KR1UV-12]|uniref:EF-hand domain-containing protein n=1 Tax=Sphingomonas aurea TaxID=3063994 RepID=A0ABT9EHJ3_9SPHN|nr:EF-hand domain-containing protein [Sphingomonas sp. KR1UV-12]MDP1026433.1 EF-hand domain-containing protein [Sphingomonas sp. KR1UV-12]
MWRYLAGGGAGLAAIAAGALVWANRDAAPAAVLPPQPEGVTAASDGPLPDTVPEATAKTREEKRFGRYDKDRDGRITREEYLASRRKAYAKLDTNGDGQLSFDEWAAKTTAKFTTADRDRSGSMSPAEFATTAVKRKPVRTTPCPPAATAPAGEG